MSETNSTTYEQALRQVAKLLKLAEHANTSPEEAGNAAAKAQALMTRFKIEWMVATSAVNIEEPEEDVVNFADRGASLEDEGAAKIARWKGSLAVSVATANQCKAWYCTKLSTSFSNGRPTTTKKATLELIGRPSDADAVRYLYQYLAREVERLTAIHGKGCGATWRNNFRMGVVETIAQKLGEEAKATRAALRTEAATGTTMALVLVDKALAKLDQRAIAVETYGKEKLKLRARSGGQTQYDHNARSQGREAGKSIKINSAKGGLTGGHKALKG